MVLVRKSNVTLGSVKLNPLPASSLEMGACQNTAQHPKPNDPFFVIFVFLSIFGCGFSPTQKKKL